MAPVPSKPWTLCGELEIKAFPQVLTMLGKPPDQPWVKNRDSIREIVSSDFLVVDQYRFGLVVSFQWGDGDKAKGSSNLAISLWRLDDALQITCSVDIKIQLVNKQGSLTKTNQSTKTPMESGTFDGWWWNGVTLDEILAPSNGWLHCGALRIACELSIQPTESKAHPLRGIPSNPSVRPTPVSFSGALGELLLQGTFADLKIEAAGGEFQAHSVVLAARSPVFRSMLSLHLREGLSRRIALPHFSVAAVKLLLSFVYAGDVQPKELETRDVAVELLDAAREFELPLLAKRCCQSLGACLEARSLVETLRIADLFGCLELQAECMRFARQCLDEVREVPLWGRLMESFPALLRTTDEGGELVRRRMPPSELDLRPVMQEVVAPAALPDAQAATLSRQVQPLIAASCFAPATVARTVLSRLYGLASLVVEERDVQGSGPHSAEPSSLRLQGAGEEAARGNFLRVEDSCGRPRYRHSDGLTVIFWSPMAGEWQLCRQRDGHPAGETLYRCRRATLATPSEGWELVAGGAPPPRIHRAWPEFRIWGCGEPRANGHFHRVEDRNGRPQYAGVGDKHIHIYWNQSSEEWRLYASHGHVLGDATLYSSKSDSLSVPWDGWVAQKGRAPAPALGSRPAFRVRGCGEGRTNGHFGRAGERCGRPLFRSLRDPAVAILWNAEHREWRLDVEGATLYVLPCCDEALPVEGWEPWSGRLPPPTVDRVAQALQLEAGGELLLQGHLRQLGTHDERPLYCCGGRHDYTVAFWHSGFREWRLQIKSGCGPNGAAKLFHSSRDEATVPSGGWAEVATEPVAAEALFSSEALMSPDGGLELVTKRLPQERLDWLHRFYMRLAEAPQGLLGKCKLGWARYSTIWHFRKPWHLPPWPLIVAPADGYNQALQELTDCGMIWHSDGPRRLQGRSRPPAVAPSDGRRLALQELAKLSPGIRAELLQAAFWEDLIKGRPLRCRQTRLVPPHLKGAPWWRCCRPCRARAVRRGWGG
uniref:BTB domain-containing protein n=1 Tax=Pyrodinium bahamense TaxID=73915 RepID=A0A7S0B847_9DINO|mmetsp:Transcript_54100/g.150068  ORF Transcript_54100/g.150068 Transcript_54100/m.150068 type:complete len:993 (+) Transcript_54100:88-3066(+)